MASGVDRHHAGMDHLPWATSVGAARAAGATSAALRRRALAAPAHGARVTADAFATDEDKAFLAALRALQRDDQCFSHTTAARAHGMPLPLRLADDPIHVASPTGGNRMRRPGVVGHRQKARAVWVDGLRVESPEDTFVHLATILDEVELTIVADWLISPRRPSPLTIEALAEHCRRFTGARGVPAALRALAAAQVGSESPRETESRLLMLDLGAPPMLLNFNVYDEQGRFLFRLDGGWPELRAGWDYDGRGHHEDPVQAARDLDRLDGAAALGWRLRRFGTVHFQRSGRPEFEAFVAEVRSRLAAFERGDGPPRRGYWSLAAPGSPLRR